MTDYYRMILGFTIFLLYILYFLKLIEEFDLIELSFNLTELKKLEIIKNILNQSKFVRIFS